MATITNNNGQSLQNVYENKILVKRITLPLIIIVAVCILPILLSIGHVGFATSQFHAPSPWPNVVVNNEFQEFAYQTLRGSFTHTILEWTAVCAAFFIAVLAFTQYRLTGEPSLPVIGIALACAGAMDAFHTLASDRLIEAVADNNNLIPFTWAICRTFNALILLVGVGLFALSKKHTARKHGSALILIMSGLFITIAYLIIHACATSQQLPQTMFPENILTRPYDIFPLIPYLLCACWIFPAYYKKRRTFFSLSLMLSMIPQIATQLYMAFGSTALHDNCFNIAHALKAFSYMVPIFGLSMQNVRTYQLLAKAEERLRNNKSLTTVLVDTANDAIITIDDRGIIQSANKATFDIFGYEQHELISKNVNMLMPPPYHNEHDGYLAYYKQTGKSKINGNGREVVGLHKDGTSFAADLSISQITIEGQRLYTGIVRNIEQRKQQEKNLYEYKLALDATADCVFMFAPDTLKINYVNESVVKQVKYSHEELMRMTIISLWPNFDENSFREMVQPLLDTDERTLTFETQQRSIDGVDTPVEVSLQFEPDIGEQGSFVSIVRDINERKQAETALQDYAAALESVNNSVEQARAESEEATRAKSDFLANMSHELRTPMNSIIGFSRRLIKKLEGNISERDFDALITVDRNAKHLLTLINDILDLSKIEAGRFEIQRCDFNFNDTLTESLSTMSALFDSKPIHLVSQLPTEAIMYHGDQIRIQQVITNLISNAVKYSEEGTVTVSLSKNFLQLEDYSLPVIKFAVKDTGIGIKPEDIDKLFNKFTQFGTGTEGKVGGTGLGLAIVAEFIRLHGGLIQVSSEYGEGSEFSVILPTTNQDISTISVVHLSSDQHLDVEDSDEGTSVSYAQRST